MKRIISKAGLMLVMSVIMALSSVGSFHAAAIEPTNSLPPCCVVPVEINMAITENGLLSVDAVSHALGVSANDIYITRNGYIFLLDGMDYFFDARGDLWVYAGDYGLVLVEALSPNANRCCWIGILPVLCRCFAQSGCSTVGCPWR